MPVLARWPLLPEQHQDLQSCRIQLLFPCFIALTRLHKFVVVQHVDLDCRVVKVQQTHMCVHLVCDVFIAVDMHNKCVLFCI